MGVPTGPGGYEKYQEWFSNRKVGAVNQGVPRFKEEIEELQRDIEEVPWDSFNEEEKVAVANIALDACRIVCRVSKKQGDIGTKEATGVMFHIGSSLFNMITGTEDPFEGAGLDLILMSDDEMG